MTDSVEKIDTPRGCPCTNPRSEKRFRLLIGYTLSLLKTLHYDKHILNEEECRSVGKALDWWDELAVVVVVKGAVQETLGVLEEYKEDRWYGRTANGIKMLSELYQEKLVTEDELKRMKGERESLSDRVALVQCTKPPEVVARTVNMLDKYGHNEEANRLRALNELFTRHLLTAEECSEVAGKERWEWEDHLNQVLSTKPAEVVEEACQVLEKHGCQVEEELKTLNELFTRHLLRAEEFSEVAKKGLWWDDHLHQVLSTKPAEVVQEACQVLEKHGCSVKELKMLSELYQEKLVTEDEVKGMKGEGGLLSFRVVIVQCTKPPEVVARTVNVLDKYGYKEAARQLRVLLELYQEKLVTEDEVKRMKGERGSLSARVVVVQCTKPPEVVARTTNVLDKYGHNEEARQLRALKELFTRHLLTAEECSEVAGQGLWWQGHLTQVLLTKPAEVVEEACKVLEKHGCHVEEELKRMLSGPGSTQTHGLPGDTFTSPEYSTDSVDSQNHTKLSSEDVEEESKHQGSKVLSEPAEGESDPHEEPEPATVKGFTQGDCSTLYHKAIRDNPTITLHVSKAMTIGPPRAGKTALRHHLLELEPPEISSSTPVMKTAETVSVCTSGVDSRMFLVSENKWVLVNNDSGILSLLTHLRDTIAARSRTAQKPVDYEKGAEDINLSSTHETEADDSLLHSSHETAPEDIMLPSTHESMHREAGIQPSGDKSASVALMSSRIYRELQNPDLANVALSDAHLLQFLDCGGQLAYHDILPLFVTIPAIYLNVFNVAKELTKCPTDELCSTEGNTTYAAKSVLSVAEMVTRSAMTVRSLADRKVPLLPHVMSESKPRLMLVGTHLDKLDEKDADEKLKASNEILHKTLQLKSRLLERAVVPNEKSKLMFFPVNNKLYVDKSHQSHRRCKCKHCCATKNLKEKITKQAMEDAVKVDVPVKWYLHQLLELSQSEKPFYSYSELYERCRAEGSVTDVGEFHAMVTYFHALGLLIHLCGADVGHTEESACLVFTNPSHLFENISKLYLVQFEEVWGGHKILLKDEGKLTRDSLRELGVQLDPDHFMDLLVQLFIGAEVKSQEGGRVLFVPSVLTSSPDDAAPSGVSTGPQEESLGFAVTFENTSFIPCGVFTGMSARLQNAEGWEICTKSISRKRMRFGVGAVGFVSLHDHATHISVKMQHHKGKHQEYRDTVIEAVADSYCFLFHSKTAKDPQSGPCSECVKSPYLVLGQTCQHDHTPHETSTAPHVAELKVENQVAASVRCQLNLAAKELDRSECDLFQNMSHYAVVKRQHTGCTLEGAGSGGIPPSQTGSETPSSVHPPIGTWQTAPTSKKAQANSTAGQPLEKRVLMECEPNFYEVVAVKDIYRELCWEHVIPQTVADRITDSHSVVEARGHLFDHMRDYGTLATLKAFCDVITSENYDGFRAMQDFGSEMRRRLEQEATQFSVSEFLKKHETEFFEVVEPRLSLLRLVRKGVITENVKSDITTSNTKDAREVLYHHLAHHANVETLKEYCEVAIDAEGYPKMQSLGRKMMKEMEQGGEQTH